MSTLLPCMRRSLKRVEDVATEELEFSVVTYNILADYWFGMKCTQKGQYTYCPNDFKTRVHGKNSKRHKLLMTELQWLDSDIICLQEVDTAYFSDILQEALSLLGYDMLFEETLGEPAGLALAFRRDKFKLIKNSKVNLNEQGQVTFKQRDFSSSAEVLLLAALRSTINNSVLAIGVTHLTWGSLRKTVTQVCEIALVTQALGELVSSLKAEGEHVAHILCGDFNIEPQFPAYEFVKEGRLTEKEAKRLKGIDYLRFGAEPEVTKVATDQLSLLNSTKDQLHSPLTTLQSAYKTVMGTEPQFTNHEGTGYVWTLDYIWFDSTTLNVTAALETVPLSAVTPYGGLPNKAFPSDHLSLKAFFKFAGKKNFQEK